MNQLQTIEQHGKRVLTTIQIAQAYGTDPRRISENFQRNAERYVYGKHYFSLEGDEKRDFINRTQIAEGQKNAAVMYLWTEKGAWMHAKSLNTGEAWGAYEGLVDGYYSLRESVDNVVPLSKDQALVAVLRTTADLVENQQEIRQLVSEQSQRLEAVARKVDEQITLDSGEQRRIQKAIARRVYDIERNEHYRREMFRQLHREIKDRWAVPSYKDVRRNEFDQVIRYIDAWRPRIA